MTESDTPSFPYTTFKISKAIITNDWICRNDLRNILWLFSIEEWSWNSKGEILIPEVGQDKIRKEQWKAMKACS